MPRLNYEELSKKRCGASSAAIRERVNGTRKRQIERYKNEDVSFNAYLESRHLEKYCILDKAAEELLKQAILEIGMSARAYDKILKLSRTIADLEEKDIIEEHHISEAIGYRSLDRNFWT